MKIKSSLTFRPYYEGMDMDFNEKGEKAKFIYSPGNAPRSYDISMFKDYKGPAGLYEVIGSYQVVDEQEDDVLAEKKISNLMKMLDGKTSIENLSGLTNTRLLYEMAPKESEFDPTVINFRTYDGNGVSRENAVLKLERGVYHGN